MGTSHCRAVYLLQPDFPLRWSMFPVSPRRIFVWLLWFVLLSACSSGLGQSATPESETAPGLSRIQAQVALPRPARVAFGEGSIWVSDSVESSILRLDAATGKSIGSPIPL